MSSAALSFEPVLVRVVPYTQARRMPAGTVLNYNDGLAVVGNDPKSVSGRWKHKLLYLSGEEYSLDRNIAIQILARARAVFASKPSADEITVTLPV